MTIWKGTEYIHASHESYDEIMMIGAMKNARYGPIINDDDDP